MWCKSVCQDDRMYACVCGVIQRWYIILCPVSHHDLDFVHVVAALLAEAVTTVFLPTSACGDIQA